MAKAGIFRWLGKQLQGRTYSPYGLAVEEIRIEHAPVGTLERLLDGYGVALEKAVGRWGEIMQQPYLLSEYSFSIEDTRIEHGLGDDGPYLTIDGVLVEQARYAEPGSARPSPYRSRFSAKTGCRVPDNA